MIKRCESCLKQRECHVVTVEDVPFTVCGECIAALPVFAEPEVEQQQPEIPSQEKRK